MAVPGGCKVAIWCVMFQAHKEDAHNPLTGSKQSLAPRICARLKRMPTVGEANNGAQHVLSLLQH